MKHVHATSSLLGCCRPHAKAKKEYNFNFHRLPRVCQNIITFLQVGSNKRLDRATRLIDATNNRTKTHQQAYRLANNHLPWSPALVACLTLHAFTLKLLG
jgi:hypothetical protein